MYYLRRGRVQIPLKMENAKCDFENCEMPINGRKSKLLSCRIIMEIVMGMVRATVHLKMEN